MVKASRDKLYHVIAYSKAQLSDVELGQKLWVYETWDFKNGQPKIQESLNLSVTYLQRFFDHIFTYDDLTLPTTGENYVESFLFCW